MKACCSKIVVAVVGSNIVKHYVWTSLCKSEYQKNSKFQILLFSISYLMPTVVQANLDFILQFTFVYNTTFISCTLYHWFYFLGILILYSVFTWPHLSILHSFNTLLISVKHLCWIENSKGVCRFCSPQQASVLPK